MANKYTHTNMFVAAIDREKEDLRNENRILKFRLNEYQAKEKLDEHLKYEKLIPDAHRLILLIRKLASSDAELYNMDLNLIEELICDLVEGKPLTKGDKIRMNKLWKSLDK